MRWLVTGARGMLGQDLVAALESGGHRVDAYDRAEVDIVDPDATMTAIRALRPDVIVNCAAWTAVDDAETHEGPAFAVSAVGAANVARAAKDVGARMVQLSTDYVFAGDAETPYPEDAPIAPRSAYGRTKAAGEWAVRSECPDSLIVRTAWLYGRNGASFPRTIARLGRERDSLDVVVDQVGQPTWTMDVASLIIALIERKAPVGVYHATSSGQCSWYEFAQAIIAADGRDPQKVKPTDSASFVRPAPRPAYSVLGHDSLAVLGIEPIGAWAERWSAAAASVLSAV